jgi:hypothetical protein
MIAERHSAGENQVSRLRHAGRCRTRSSQEASARATLPRPEPKNAMHDAGANGGSNPHAGRWGRSGEGICSSARVCFRPFPTRREHRSRGALSRGEQQQENNE